MDIAGLISTVETVASDTKIAFEDAIIIGRAIPGIHADVKAGKALPEILAGLEPDALAVVESVANIVFPGAGSAIGVLAYIVGKSQPLVPGSIEEKNYFDKATGGGW